MKILLKSSIIFFDIIDKFVHQKKILNFFLKSNFNIRYFVDVGCHKGLYTDLFLKSFKIKKIIVFEPQLKIYHYIKKKYKNVKKIKIFNLAVSNKKKILNLNLNHHDLTTTLSKFNKDSIYLKLKALLFGVKNMTFKQVKVKSVRLDSILFVKNFQKVDLLKIDTEGHELEVLKGLGKKIQKVKYILIEFHNDLIYQKYNPKKIHNYLIRNNFSLKAKFEFPFTTWEDRIYFNRNEF